MSMPKGPFVPSEFVPTKFSTAADKAEFGNAFLHFIESEWKETLFTKTFYNRLSNTFGHIAHYVECVIMRSGNAKTTQNAPSRRHNAPHNPMLRKVTLHHGRGLHQFDLR
jgi:hypothetical protein